MFQNLFTSQKWMTANSVIKALRSQNELTIKRAKTVYTSAISNICTKFEQRFSTFVESVVVSNILLSLDTKSWPKDDSVTFGNYKINKLTDHDTALLKKKHGYDVTKIPSEWTHLKYFSNVAQQP